jgi:hypothetical protein
VAELAVKAAVEHAGAVTAQSLNTTTERKAKVDLNPRYGAWSGTDLQVLLGPEPLVADVLNAPANAPDSAAATPVAATPSGQSG